jgi:hypothetical protein
MYSYEIHNSSGLKKQIQILLYFLRLDKDYLFVQISKTTEK